MPIDSMRQLETAVGLLSTEVSRLRDDMRDQAVGVQSELRAISSEASAARTQIIAHVAVCEERARLSAQRQIDRDSWAKEQAEVFARFMEASSADRAAIHSAVRAVREEITSSTIKVLWWVVSLNVAAIIAMIGTWLKAYGPHL